MVMLLIMSVASFCGQSPYNVLQATVRTQTLPGKEIPYTRSPLEDSRLFGPSPWKILATTCETNDF